MSVNPRPKTINAVPVRISCSLYETMLHVDLVAILSRMTVASSKKSHNSLLKGKPAFARRLHPEEKIPAA
jgi:hypothetical protein